MGTHPLAIVSLGASLVAYGSAFVGSAMLLWPALAVAAVAIVAGVLARRAIGAEPHRYGGRAFATAGIVSGGAFVLLGAVLLTLMGRAAGV